MTARTSSSRAAHLSAPGTSNRIPDSEIFRLARTSRCASVASGSTNAAAICRVVSPATNRSVSATRTSSARAGWQQANTSPSWSSPPTVTGGASLAEAAPVSGNCCGSTAIARFPRSWSTAFRHAVVMSQPPGLGGVPSRAHTRAAAANASAAASSAACRSPSRRASVATTADHSSR